MHIFSVKKAALSLKENRLSEWQKTRYLISTFILSITYAAIGSLISPEFFSPKHDKAIGYLLCIPVFYFSFRSLFLINQKIDNNDFIGRSVVLGFPSMNQSLLISWLIYLIAMLISVTIFPLNETFIDIVNITFAPAVYVLYYLRLKKGFHELRAVSTHEELE